MEENYYQSENLMTDIPHVYIYKRLIYLWKRPPVHTPKGHDLSFFGQTRPTRRYSRGDTVVLSIHQSPTQNFQSWMGGVGGILNWSFEVLHESFQSLMGVGVLWTEVSKSSVSHSNLGWVWGTILDKVSESSMRSSNLGWVWGGAVFWTEVFK